MPRGRPSRTGLVLIPLALAFAPAAASAAETKPTAPRSVEASPGPATADVTWKRPRSDGGARIDAYKIVRTAPGETKATELVSGRKLSLTAGQLTPGTTYTFTVSAHNKRGWSKASKGAEAVPFAEAGFGEITGTCGVVKPQLELLTPSLFENRIDFGDDWFDPGDRSKLTPGGQVLFDTPSAGGSSTEAEIMAFEVLDRCEGASLVKTETQIVYDQPGAITDLSVEIGGKKVGISVTRAYRPMIFTQADADALITEKLEDVNESSQNVSEGDAWVKQVLVAFAFEDAAADKVEVAFAEASAELRADTVLYLITTDGADGSIYCNPDGPTCP